MQRSCDSPLQSPCEPPRLCQSNLRCVSILGPGKAAVGKHRSRGSPACLWEIGHKQASMSLVHQRTWLAESTWTNPDDSWVGEKGREGGGGGIFNLGRVSRVGRASPANPNSKACLPLSAVLVALFRLTAKAYLVLIRPTTCRLASHSCDPFPFLKEIKPSASAVGKRPPRGHPFRA